MQCPVCGNAYSRKGWFAVQWKAESPIVMGTQSGDYDRCKACYAGDPAPVPCYAGDPAPVPPVPAPAAAGAGAAAAAAAVDTKWDEHSKMLCRYVIVQSQRCGRLNEFIDYWVERAMHRREDLCGFGAIDCRSPTDPTQYLFGQRWTFDPMNYNYEKAFYMAWPAHVRQMNRVTIGNILESLLGVRNMGDRNGWGHDSQRAVIVSVCQNLSDFVNAVYQLTKYTDTVYDGVDAWTRYVTYHAYH